MLHSLLQVLTPVSQTPNDFWLRLCSGQPGQAAQPSPYWKLSEGEGAVLWTISTKWSLQIKCYRMNWSSSIDITEIMDAWHMLGEPSIEVVIPKAWWMTFHGEKQQPFLRFARFALQGTKATASGNEVWSFGKGTLQVCQTFNNPSTSWAFHKSQVWKFLFGTLGRIKSTPGVSWCHWHFWFELNQNKVNSKRTSSCCRDGWDICLQCWHPAVDESHYQHEPRHSMVVFNILIPKNFANIFANMQIWCHSQSFKVSEVLLQQRDLFAWVDLQCLRCFGQDSLRVHHWSW